MPVDGGERAGVVLQQSVRGDDHVEGSDLLDQPRARRRGPGAGGDVEGRCEAARLVEPVRDHRSRRDHQGRAARGAVEQQREGLHGLSEAHVVGETGARAPPREPREPAEAVALIRAELRLEGARQLRFERLRVAHPCLLRAPSRVRVERRALGEVPECERRHGVHAHRAARGRRGEAAQIVELTAERCGEGNELAVSDLQEPGVRARIEQREQLLEVEHSPFIDRKRAGGAEPLRRRLDRQAQARGRRLRHDPERLTLRPQAGRLRRVELLQQLQRTGRLGEHPRRRCPGGCGERRAGGGEALGGGPFGREVAPRLHRLAVADGEHRRPARAGLEPGPGPRDGLDHQLRGESRPRGLEPHPGPGVRLDRTRRVGAARDAPVDADLRGKGGNRVQQPGSGRGGQLQAALGDDRPQPPVAAREPRDLAAAVVHELHVVVLRVRAVGREACTQAPLVLVDDELGLPSHDLHRGTGFAEDMGMTGKLEQPRAVEVVVPPAVPIAALPDLRRRGAVLLQQEIHARGRRGEPLHRNRPAGGPCTVLVLVLLARLRHDLAEVFAELPRQPAPARG